MFICWNASCFADETRFYRNIRKWPEIYVFNFLVILEIRKPLLNLLRYTQLKVKNMFGWSFQQKVTYKYSICHKIWCHCQLRKIWKIPRSRCVCLHMDCVTAWIYICGVLFINVGVIYGLPLCSLFVGICLGSV